MIFIELRIPNLNRHWDLRRAPQTRNAPDGKWFVMANLRKIYGCPVELSLELLGEKWKSVILVRFLDHIASATTYGSPLVPRAFSPRRDRPKDRPRLSAPISGSS
jgi:hypothetical protein